MRRPIIALLLILFPCFLQAQNNTSIRCSFPAAIGDSISLTTSQYYIDEYEKAYHPAVKGNECAINFLVLKPGVAKLSYGGKSRNLFVEKGYELHCTIASDSSVSFSGIGAADNEFFSSFQNTFQNDFNKEEIAKEILSTDVDAFEMKLFDEKKKQFQFYNSYSKKSDLSDDFKQYIENTIRYHYYSTLLSYPIIQANQSAQITVVKAFPASMLEGIDAKLMNDAALNCEAYREFLFYYNTYKTSEANGFNKFKDYSLSFESKVNMANKTLPQQSLVWYIAWFLNNDIQKLSLYTTQHMYDVLKLKEEMAIYSALLKPKVEARLKQKDVAAVNQSPAGAGNQTAASSDGFPKLKDIDGKYFTFDDLKGKVVYVDYWASWCGPCMGEMPYSKQLHAMFTEEQLKKIVFLYISIDATEEAWKSAVNKIGMEGKLAISPGNWQSPIAQYFQINSIPRYMLIDKKGNIVDLNAKRPSSGAGIYQDILKLLNN